MTTFRQVWAEAVEYWEGQSSDWLYTAKMRKYSGNLEGSREAVANARDYHALVMKYGHGILKEAA